jgi:hypothetical protein
MAKEEAAHHLTPWSKVPCCPELDLEATCDVLDLRRRLIFPTRQTTDDGRPVHVEVTIHSRFKRCSGPLALGDIVYSTTLLPGETVRLATTDRRSRFSFDSETNLSYRSEQMSEEQYRMTALRTLMADENSTDSSSEKASSDSRWDFHGDASGSIGLGSVNADTNANGSYNAHSSRDWLRQHRAHAQMADSQSVSATRMAHSVSVGEVSSRTHQEGESEDHFESSSRVIHNENRCHAVTYLFYRINKTETITFSIEEITRRVIDPVAPTPIQANPFRPVGQIATIAQEVPATAKERLAVEQRGLQSELQYQQARGGLAAGAVGRFAVRAFAASQPISDVVRDAALAEVDQDLRDQDLIDKVGGVVSPKAKEEFGYERRTSIPTAGIIVKGCLDECNVCEPGLKRKIELELELQKKQIDLLEKSQEYRCCPVGSEETDNQP